MLEQGHGVHEIGVKISNPSTTMHARERLSGMLDTANALFNVLEDTHINIAGGGINNPTQGFAVSSAAGLAPSMQDQLTQLENSLKRIFDLACKVKNTI